MAIFNMSDSSINEYLEESSKGRTLYKKSDKAFPNGIFGGVNPHALQNHMVKQQAKNTGEALSKLPTPLLKAAYKSEHKALKSGKLEKKIDKENEKAARKAGATNIDRDASRELSKTIHNKDVLGRMGKELHKRGVDVNALSGKKKQLEEAAKYILSVLDEMDYKEINNKVKNMTEEEREKFVKKYMHPDLPKKLQKAWNNPIKLDSLSDDEDK